MATKKSFRNVINQNPNKDKLDTNNPALQFFTEANNADGAGIADVTEEKTNHTDHTNKVNTKEVNAPNKKDVDTEGDYQEGSLRFVELSLLSPSESNMNYEINMNSYDQALIIFKQLLSINKDLLSAPETLSAALVAEEDSSYYPILKQYKNHTGAINLLILAGSIKDQGQLQAPPAREREDGTYVLVDGMKRFLALKILGERFMSIKVAQIAEDDEKTVSVVANVQTYKPSDIDYGRNIEEIVNNAPWLNYEQIGAKLGISRKQVEKYRKKYNDFEQQDQNTKKPSPKLEKQVVIDDERGKLLWSGTEKLSPKIIRALQDILIEL